VNDERLLTNRRNWNERTPVHAATEFYDVEGFKAGRITLTDVERREVGDVDGKTLLHLQCHFGLDTMSWARLGAKATGVDFSDAAIDLARSLNDELELNTRFIRSDVYDLPDVLDEEFDIVDAVEVSESGALHATYGYFHREVAIAGNQPSYVGRELMSSPHYSWQHTLGDVVTALIEAGLTIEFLHEFPFCSEKYPGIERCDDGRWRFPRHGESFPHMYSIKASR
jgi:SAM-dependent methyltransferase